MGDFNLGSVVLPEKVVEFEYPGLEGLKVELAFISKEETQKILKKCTKTRFDKKSRSTVDEVDDELFLKVYVKAIVKGWSGFKFKYLDEFLVWDSSNIDDLEDEFNYSVDNAVTIMKNSSEFDAWVSEQIGELSNFTKTS